eukprot:jgi/Galph1/4097/GphlegSOOS_G2760.1
MAANNSLDNMCSTPTLAPSKDSLSLWNFSLSPGWTKEEVRILSLCLMSIGVGRWQRIVDSGYLPNKTISQLNLQTQRLLGQQSVAEFTGLCIDPAVVRQMNEKRIEQGAKTKGGIIVNTGPNPTKEVILSRLKENSQKFALTSEQIVLANAQLASIIEGQNIVKDLSKLPEHVSSQATLLLIEQSKKMTRKHLCVDKTGLVLLSIEEKGDKNLNELREYLTKLNDTLMAVQQAKNNFENMESVCEEEDKDVVPMQDKTNIPFQVDSSIEPKDEDRAHDSLKTAENQQAADVSYTALEKPRAKRRR